MTKHIRITNDIMMNRNRYIYFMKNNSFKSARYAAKNPNLWLFVIFAGGVFLQCILFSWLAYHSLPISSLWRDPLHFWATYLPKISVSLILASGVFLFRRKYWIIWFTILLDIWILVEVFYFRANRIFIDASTIFLLRELHGFESSLSLYLSPDLCLLLIPVFLVSFAVYLFDNSIREWKSFLLSLVCCITVNGISNKVVDKAHTYGTFGTSIVHMFFTTTKNFIAKPFVENYQMTPKDTEDIQRFLHPQPNNGEPKHPLVLILVESLETWAIRPDITPNLYQFIKSHNVVFANHVISQTRGGSSADGQMIYNTGLLPIADGAVCHKYTENVFPSLSENYQNTVLIQPGLLTVWNQAAMNVAYHIHTSYEHPEIRDHHIFNTLDSISKGQYDYILALTMATHTPFLVCSQYSSLLLPEDMPEPMRNYLLCLNYTDSCWGNFLERIDTDTTLKNSVICFMGDHIIFDPIMRNEMHDYCRTNGLDFTPKEAYTAFFAYSPDLQETHAINEVMYQMDAYPTIRHLIGADYYYWCGFGVNLLDSNSIYNRPISEEEAYNLSDKIIRANFFKDVRQ